MTRINKDTGQFFAEDDVNQYLQSVVDRLLVFAGSRIGRPDYGTQLGHISPQSTVIKEQIRKALDGDEGVRDIQISSHQGVLTVRVRYDVGFVDVRI